MNVKIAHRCGKKYSSKARLKAKALRRAGLTHREIQEKLARIDLSRYWK